MGNCEYMGLGSQEVEKGSLRIIIVHNSRGKDVEPALGVAHEYEERRWRRYTGSRGADKATGIDSANIFTSQRKMFKTP